MIVLAFPPKLSLSSHVKTELRYGINNFFLASLLMAFSLASATMKSTNNTCIFSKYFPYIMLVIKRNLMFAFLETKEVVS